MNNSIRMNPEYETGRSDFLRDLIGKAVIAHDAWARGSSAWVSGELDQCMTDLIEGFAEGSIPADCRELESLVRAFARHWQAWRKLVERAGSSTVAPSSETWDTWDAIADAFRKETPTEIESPRIESVATLHEQGVSERQICEIYEWVDERGIPDIRKLREELAEPGKHSNGFVDPVTRRRQEQAEQARAEVEEAKRKRKQKMEAMGAKPRESLEDLVHQDVSLPQIASILEISEADVLRQCEAAGLPRPGATPNLHAERSLVDPDRNESQERILDSLGSNQMHGVETEQAADSSDLTLEQKIIELHRKGLEASEIASELTTNDQKISRQKVQAVVKRYSEDPEAVTMPT